MLPACYREGIVEVGNFGAFARIEEWIAKVSPRNIAREVKDSTNERDYEELCVHDM